MSTENSSLIFDVKTQAALQNLEALETKLRGTLGAFAAAEAAMAKSGASQTALMRSAGQAMSAEERAASRLNAEIEDLGRKSKKARAGLTELSNTAAKMNLGKSLKIGNMRVSLRAAVDAGKEVGEAFDNAIAKSIANPDSLLAAEKAAAEKLARERLKIAEQAAYRGQARRAEFDNDAGVTRVMSKKQLAARRADAIAAFAEDDMRTRKHIAQVNRALAEGDKARAAAERAKSAETRRLANADTAFLIRDAQQREAVLKAIGRGVSSGVSRASLNTKYGPAALAAYDKYVKELASSQSTAAAERAAAERAAQEKLRRAEQAAYRGQALRAKFDSEAGVTGVMSSRQLAARRADAIAAFAEDDARTRKHIAQVNKALAEGDKARAAAERAKSAETRRLANADTAFLVKDAQQRETMLRAIDRGVTSGVARAALNTKYGPAALAAYDGITDKTRLRTLNETATGFRNNTTAMREAHSAARGLAGAMGQMWMTWGSLTPLLAGAGVGMIARQTYTVGKDVEYRLAMLQALGNAPVSVDQMMPAVQGSMKTPLEAAQGLQELAQAGLNSNDSLYALGTTLQLATLGEMSVADAALTATSAMSTFKLAIQDVTQIGDIYAKAQAISNTTVAGIAEAMKQAGSAASIYGVSLQETVAQVATLAQSGIRGTAAGTAIKNAMTELYAPTKKAAAVMEQIGLKIYDSSGQARNFIDILTDLKGTYVGLDDESRNSLLKSMFNERSRRAIQIFMQDLNGLKTTNDQLSDSFGFLAQSNAVLLQTVEGSSNRMQSVLQQTLVKSFDNLRPQIVGTLRELESAFGSDGFREGVEMIGRTFANLTTIIVTNSSNLLLAVGVYGAFRLTLAAASAMTKVAEVALAAKSRTMTVLTSVMGANTAATAANTAAQAANSAATAAAGGRLATVAGGIARVIPGLNAISMLLVGGAAAWATYRAATGIGDAKAAAEASNLEKITEAIRNQTAALREQMAQQRMAAGQTPWTMQAETANEKALALKLENDIASMDQEIAAIEARRAAVSPEALRWQAGGARAAAVADTKRLAELEKERADAVERRARAEAAVENAPKALTEYQRLAEEAKAAAKAREYLSRVEGIAGDRDFAKDADAVKLSSFYSEAEALAAELRDAEKVTEKQEKAAQSLMKRYAEAREHIAFGAGGGGGADSLIFRSNSANLQQELNNQKTLVKAETDFRIGLLKTERDEGVITSESYVEQRKAALASFNEWYLKASQETAAKIRALDKGAPELKELTAEKIREQQAQAARLAEQQERFEDERRESQLRTDVKVANGKIAADRAVALSQLAELERDRKFQVEKLGMFEHQVQMQEARNAAEAIYTSMLDKQTKLLERGRGVNARFDESPEGQNLLREIELTERLRKGAGDTASANALHSYEVANSPLEGYRRAIKEVGDQALLTGDVVRNSLTTSFNAVGGAVAGLVTTGKTSVRGLISDVTSQIASMWANRLVAQFFSMIMPTFGGITGGVGASLANPMSSMVPTITGGTTAITIGSVNAKGNAFSHGTVTAFAKGGAFTNTVASSTTVAPMAMFGEAGPEAIMPLTRAPGGELGVRAVTTNTGSQTSGGNMFSFEFNFYGADGKTTTSQSGAEGGAEMELMRKLGDMFKGLLVKELNYGGMIDTVIRRKG